MQTYETLRTMKGKGRKVSTTNLAVGDVVRVDGMKYRVAATPRPCATGSIEVEVYSENNQHDTLYLSSRAHVTVLGNI